jgi:hypothetical protein
VLLCGAFEEGCSRVQLVPAAMKYLLLVNK